MKGSYVLMGMGLLAIVMCQMDKESSSLEKQKVSLENSLDEPSGVQPMLDLASLSWEDLKIIELSNENDKETLQIIGLSTGGFASIEQMDFNSLYHLNIYDSEGVLVQVREVSLLEGEQPTLYENEEGDLLVAYNHRQVQGEQVVFKPAFISWDEQGEEQSKVVLEGLPDVSYPWVINQEETGDFVAVSGRKGNLILTRVTVEGEQRWENTLPLSFEQLPIDVQLIAQNQAVYLIFDQKHWVKCSVMNGQFERYSLLEVMGREEMLSQTVVSTMNGFLVSLGVDEAGAIVLGGFDPEERVSWVRTVSEAEKNLTPWFVTVPSSERLGVLILEDLISQEWTISFIQESGQETDKQMVKPSLINQLSKVEWIGDSFLYLKGRFLSQTQEKEILIDLKKNS